jgi:plastocyanin
MTTPRISRTLAFALLPLLLGAGLASSAQAGNVKGALHLPEALRAGRQHLGYWRLENGNVPVRSAPSKTQAVVVLEGISGTHPPAPRTVTVEISGLDAQPRVVIIGPGSVVEFKNVGKVTHELSIPANTTLMPIERLNPGTFRHQKFGLPGGYVVRCSQYPHLAISVIVVDSPFYAIADEKGAFFIPGVPDVRANLKVWTQGRWVHEHEIDTASKQDLSIRVAATRSERDGEKEPEPSETDSKDASD